MYLSWPRLILASILNGRFDNFFTVIGLVCSSWVTVSQGTHCRAPWFPLGMEKFEFVRIGNALTARILDQIQQLGSGPRPRKGYMEPQTIIFMQFANVLESGQINEQSI